MVGGVGGDFSQTVACRPIVCRPNNNSPKRLSPNWFFAQPSAPHRRVPDRIALSLQCSNRHDRRVVLKYNKSVWCYDLFSHTKDVVRYKRSLNIGRKEQRKGNEEGPGDGRKCDGKLRRPLSRNPGSAPEETVTKLDCRFATVHSCQEDVGK